MTSNVMLRTNDPRIEPVALRLARHTVGFMAEELSETAFVLAPKGSGTVISIDGAVCILTAAHVAERLMEGKFGAVYGIANPGRSPKRAMRFRTEYCDLISFGGKAQGMDGPDICAIKLPPEATAWLRSERVPYNFELRYAQFARAVTHLPATILMGLPTEATGEIVKLTEDERTDRVTLYAMGGERFEEVNTDRFDRFSFRTQFPEAAALPTFGGLSGGGLWLYDPNTPETLPVLCGVAYYQSDRGKVGARAIACAGPRSVYDVLYVEALQRWGKTPPTQSDTISRTK